MDLKSIKQLYHERHLTSDELKKREEIATAMEKEHPGLGSTKEGMSKKMAIATVVAKKSCHETVEDLDERSMYDLVVNYYRHLGLDPYKLRGEVGKRIRDKIKDSPSFLAWSKLNSSYEYEKKYTNVIEELKKEKKQSKHKVYITFLGGYQDEANTSSPDLTKSSQDTNFISSN